jgi:hypothetical protein
MTAPKKPTKQDCSGCHNDFYNGHNGLGVQTCWHLADATFVKARDIYINQMPPFNHIPITTKPSCYKAQQFVRVKPEDLSKDGYWK